MIAGEKTAIDSKQKIRTRYKGVDPSELEVIPAIATDEIALEERKLKVAAYVRVSTENDEQTSSYELQVNDFTDRINANPNWEFAGIYSDEGISGTELSHRKGMLQMIEDARAGKIDHILAKSIARFARNVVDCLSIIDELKKLGVGVHFDENNLYTLDSTGALVLTILATVAEEESRSKSFIMNWSIERRFSKGIFLTPKLLGYDVDENGELVVNPEEAETVKVIYDLYINGWSTTEIAELLTSYGRKTKLGNEVWNPTSIDGVIENERHCGDVRSRKTYTPDFKTHKSVKNRQNRKQYIQRNHHEAIVSRDVYNAANLLKSSHQYTAKSRPLPVLSVIDGGILTGYVPVDKNWSGFSTEDYQAACESVEVPTDDVKVTGRRLNMGGYQLVRPEFFPSIERPAMTISNGKLRFNTACLKKFEDVEYVELLLNTVKNCIAIRPCEKDNPNAIHWGKLREERWVVSTLGCKGLSRTLFDLMSWEDEGQYRFSGQYKAQGDNKLLIFELGEPVITKTVEQIVVPEQPDEADEEEQQEEIVIREKVRVFPDSWRTSYGVPITAIVHASVLEQHHYAGDWDVLRPATELEEMNIFTADQLDQLMKEAETIMEGWTKTA
ncbi:MAG: recombinase family protein [Oscillospiraceae bacterium]|nr:recombinase family protein [Oscillospiraceae bacterium]